MLAEFEGLDIKVEDQMDDGAQIKLHATIMKSQLTLDFEGTGPVHSFTMNANKAIVKSAILYVLRCILKEDIPLNEGVLDPVHLILPNSFINPPSEGEASKRAAVSAGNVSVSKNMRCALKSFWSFSCQSGNDE